MPQVVYGYTNAKQTRGDRQPKMQINDKQWDTNMKQCV